MGPKKVCVQFSSLSWPFVGVSRRLRLGGCSKDQGMDPQSICVYVCMFFLFIPSKAALELAGSMRDNVWQCDSALNSVLGACARGSAWAQALDLISGQGQTKDRLLAYLAMTRASSNSGQWNGFNVTLGLLAEDRTVVCLVQPEQEALGHL